MGKNNKNKKSKKGKNKNRDKHISVSNKNNINIKITTEHKKRSQSHKNGKYKYSRGGADALPQYPSITQYNPPAQVVSIPELNYTELARHYLKEEPRAVREGMLIEDAPKDTSKKDKKPYTPIKRLKSIIRREPAVDIDSFDALMKVKTIKALKDIFKSAGVPRTKYY